MNFGQKKLNIVHVVTFVDAYIHVYPYICYFPHEKKDVVLNTFVILKMLYIT